MRTGALIGIARAALASACVLAATSAHAASPPPLELYGQLPKTEAVALSADGTMVAMVVTDGDTRMLRLEKVGGGVIMQARMGELKLFGLAWAGNEFVVVYTHETAKLSFRSEHGQEIIQGVVIGAKDGSIKPLLRQSPAYLPAIFGQYGFAKQAGHWCAYVGVVPLQRSQDSSSSAGHFKQGYPDLYRVDLATGDVGRVTYGSADLRSWVIGGDGNIVAESEYEPNDGSWKVFLPGTPGTPVMTGKTPFGFRLVGQSRAPGTVLVGEGGDSGNIVELHLDNGQVDNFLPSGRAAELIHSPATHLLLGAVLVDDNQMLMFDPALERRFRGIAKAFQGDAVRLVSTSADLSRIIVHVQGKDTAGTWQLVDFGTGKAEPLADDYPGIPDGMIGDVRMFDYRAADGLSLQGVLTLPPGRPVHNLPVIVMPHGGPEARDRVHFDWWAQAFAAHGYAVFQPNFRGSSGYGMEFRNAGFGQWGRKMQTDVSDGLAALAAQGIVDPKRACIVGASYGGYAALAGVTLQHGLYRCAASYGGLADPYELLKALFKAHNTRGVHRYADPSMRYTESYLGVDSTLNDTLQTISPKEHAADADAPILLMHGKNDTVVPIEQSEDMEAALKRAGKAVELVELDGEDHWLSRSATRLQMLKTMMTFVEKYDPPEIAVAH
jgi:dipeptidyl aminopeptidase/acylaminoacyl peptidase